MSTTAALQSAAWPVSVPVLPPGSIAFANASGALAQDNAHFSYDSAHNALLMPSAVYTPGVPAPLSFYSPGSTDFAATRFGDDLAILAIQDNNDANNHLQLFRIDTVQQTNSLHSIAAATAGTGYTTATVTVSAPDVTGRRATATATIIGGSVTAYTVTDPGFGYLQKPTVTVTGDGTGATATASIQQGKTNFATTSYTLPDNGGDGSPILALQTGGGSGSTLYHLSGLRPVGLTDYGMSLQGASEMTVDGASQVALLMPGAQGFPAIQSTTVAGASFGTGTGLKQVTSTAAFPTPGGTLPLPLTGTYPATMFLRLKSADGLHVEWVAITATSMDATHFNVTRRGYGGGAAFDFPVGSTVDLAYRSDALLARIDDGISGGIVFQPGAPTHYAGGAYGGNGFSSDLYAWAVGMKQQDAPPTGPGGTGLPLSYALMDGTMAAVGMTLANNNALNFRNTAGGIAPVVKLDASNQVVIGDIANASGGAAATIYMAGAVESFRSRSSDGGFRHANVPLAFFGSTPAAKQTVTGAKGSNAALGSVIAALVAYGIITDTTTA